MLNRRRILCATGFIPLLLAGCTGQSNPAVSLSQAQAYVDDLVGAITAAAQAYRAGRPAPSSLALATLNMLVTDLQVLNNAFQKITDPINAKTTVLQILAVVNQITPLVSPYLDGAAPFIPLAIAIASAFVQALPAPPEAPHDPPAALHRMALKARKE